MSHRYIQTDGYKKTAQEIEQMASKLREGDASQISALIECHIKLAYQISKRFINSYPKKKDDIIAAAFYGLSKAVNWAYEGRLYDDGITKYIQVTVQRHIRDFLETDHKINIPRKTFKRLIELNETIEFVPVIVPINHDTENENEDFYLEDYQENVTDQYVQHYKIFEELFFILKLTDIERQIVELRLDGYTQAEIGQKLNRTQQSIQQILKGIQDRIKYTELANEYRLSSHTI